MNPVESRKKPMSLCLLSPTLSTTQNTGAIPPLGTADQRWGVRGTMGKLSTEDSLFQRDSLFRSQGAKLGPWSLHKTLQEGFSEEVMPDMGFAG